MSVRVLHQDTDGIAVSYPFKTVPYKHQLRCWEMSKDREFFAFFMEMGTGKSKVGVDTAAWLYDQGKINGMVIVAPKGVCPTWETQIMEHVPEHIPHTVGRWRADLNKSELADLKRLLEVENRLHVLIINVEAIITVKGFAAINSFLLGHKSLLIVDESTSIKNPKAKRTKALLKLGKRCEYRRIMSGAPITNSPLDLFSQFEFLREEVLGFSNFYTFKTRFAVTKPVMMNGRRFDQIVGFRDLADLQGLIAPHSFIVKKADCLDLPAKIYQTRHVELSSEQRKAYDQMKQQAVVLLESAEKGRVVDAGNVDDKSTQDLGWEELSQSEGIMVPERPAMSATLVLTQLMRLHQIVCGFVKPDGAKTDGVAIEGTIPRMSELLELVKECDKVVIWATYRFNILKIIETLTREFGPDSVVHYFGDTLDKDRGENVRKFQDPSSPTRFWVGNPGSGRYGLTLVTASTAIYYSNSYNTEHRIQSEDRVHRIGQKCSVNYVDLVSPGTVDEKIKKVIEKNKQLAGQVIVSNWRWLLGA